MSELYGHDSEYVLRILQQLVILYRLWIQSGEIDVARPVREVFQAIDKFSIVSDNDAFKIPRETWAPIVEALGELSINVYHIEANRITITQACPDLRSHSIQWTCGRIAQEVFNVYNLSFGQRDPRTLRSLYELAIAQSWQGHVESALRLAETLYGLNFEMLGESHRNTLNAKRLCGELLVKSGRVVNAVKVLEECYQTLLRSWKETSKLTLECAFSLAEAYHTVGQLGRPQEADGLMEQMVKGRQGHHSKAVDTLKQILSLNKYADPSYGSEHERVQEFRVKVNHSIAVCHFQGGNWERASVPNKSNQVKSGPNLT
ncbi:hypothetical protein QBC36DRAFT_356190 [Triangularia setosa]|uniref:Kinesin light chain n=1 Tax=Triangularia setosa TaxID=2587417 RepID=A0AAN6W3R8_9PEZI|nr:hypothetical protein QBC36DRAFT_356190 [Podospora setosa]